jgi:hypothetical protein
MYTYISVDIYILYTVIMYIIVIVSCIYICTVSDFS